MTTLTAKDLHNAAQSAQLSARFVDGHVALYMVVKQMDPTCILHRYSLRFDSMSTCETSYGFALQCNDLVWGLGNLVGWDAIEQAETILNGQLFEQWSGGPAVSVIFLREVVDQPLTQTPYVQDKIKLLQNFFSGLIVSQ